MSEFKPTFHFDGDEVFAIHDRTVIASGKIAEMDRVESDAVAYLDSLAQEQASRKREAATHIVTPNGLKGRILNRVDGVWGEEVSVRFENGQTSRFTVTARTVKEWMTENPKTASASPVAALEERLNSNYEHDRDSLVARHASLQEISREARELIGSGVSYADQVKLDEIRVTADAEGEQVTNAIEYVDSDDVQAYRPPQPQVVQQADLGNQSAGDWLSVVVDDMIAENADNDFEKLLTEDPDVLAAGLDDSAVVNQGVAREIALSYVMDKTAGFVGEEVENYRDKFLARFEQARRREASVRTTTRKEAAAVKESNVADTPDEALFG
jgi:hypothetical protein